VNVNIERNVPLAPHTSLRVGGPADFFVLARSTDDLVEALRWSLAQAVPARVIGGGSNLLVADAGVEGLVIKVATAHSQVAERDGRPVLVADAGVTFANVARRLAKQGFSGLEWAANVPGTVGGAAVNNAGAFGGDTASCLVGLSVVDADGNTRWLEPADLRYGYRSSLLKQRDVPGAVLQVELRLEESTPERAQATVRAFQAQRTRSQPRILSAGSVFANPPGDFAGRLIEGVGLKGARSGHAQISEQHANFIVNPGGARAADVYALMRQAQTAVFERSGLWLRPEIELFGRWSHEQRDALLGGVLSHG
jgi:UDP-N-acetylmuramate dehydrogenase